MEHFPSDPTPISSSSLPNRPTTPRTGSGKLRKAQPVATSPPLELRLEFSTDFEKELGKQPLRERKASLIEEGKKREKSPATPRREKKAKDVSRSHTSSPTAALDEEDKGILGGLLRFRTKSKERKAAAKQALQQVATGGVPRTTTPPIRNHTPLPLPIAERFVRPKDEVAFRPQIRESASSHGGTSVGHEKSGSDAGSVDAHVHLRPRDRSSRYERPHPVWRSGPTTIGRVGTVNPGEGAKSLPAEVHVPPPNQTIFDREPVRSQRAETSLSTPKIDMDEVNKYYGITPQPSPIATTPPTIPATPTPQSQFALAQALAPAEAPKTVEPHTPHSTTPVPPSPSPYIVPSPAPDQAGFGVQKRERRGRMHIPLAADAAFIPPRRKTGPINPPPTPPPMTELPPIPTDIPPSSASLRLPISSPLASRSPSPGMRMASTVPGGFPPPPPYTERPGTLATDYMNARPTSPPTSRPRSASPVAPMRAVSPVQRGKTPAFPVRPITPTRPITSTNRAVSPTRQPQGRTSPVSPKNGPGQNLSYLLNRRPSVDRQERQEYARPRRSSLNENDLVVLRQQQARQQASQPIPRSKPLYNASTGTRKSLRRSQFQSGYDSDDADSKYSRDTYYGRETAYFDDQNMPPLPGMGGDVPPVPKRDLSNVEMERQAGRERLLRFLASREA